MKKNNTKVNIIHKDKMLFKKSTIKDDFFEQLQMQTIQQKNKKQSIMGGEVVLGLNSHGKRNDKMYIEILYSTIDATLIKA